MSQEATADRVRAAAAQVYAASLAEFIPRRTALVKAARAEGDRAAAKEIAALRKPSVAAWAINLMVRERPEVLDSLRSLGDRMRHAQSTLDARTMAALRGERETALSGLVTAAREVVAEHGASTAAGGLTAAVEAEVRDTGIAALADLAAQEVAWSGALTRALSYSGFGEVDIADAVAQTSTGVILARLPGGAGATGDTVPEPVAGQDQSHAPEQPAEAAAKTHVPAQDDEPDSTSGEADSDPVADALPHEAAAERVRQQIAAADATVAAAEREVSARLAEIESARRRVEATTARLEKLRRDLQTTQREQDEASAALAKATDARKKATRALADAEDVVSDLRDELARLGG